jgi:hypothetical protein
MGPGAAPCQGWRHTPAVRGEAQVSREQLGRGSALLAAVGLSPGSSHSPVSSHRCQVVQPQECGDTGESPAAAVDRAPVWARGRTDSQRKQRMQLAATV